MKSQKSHHTILVVVIGLMIVVFVVALCFFLKPSEQEQVAEQIIHSYLTEREMAVKPRTQEYKLFMRSILFGEQPELTTIGDGYVNSQEELDYVLSYAWEYSGYKKLYGGYEEEEEIEEAKIPTIESEIR